MITSCSAFWETAKLFPTVAAPFYISINIAAPSLPTLACCSLSLWLEPSQWMWTGTGVGFFFLLYNIVLVLPYINMHPPRVYTCSPSWTLLPRPSPYHPSGSSQFTSSKHPVSCSNLDWQFISYTILYMFQCYSPKSFPPPSPTESKRLFYTSVSLLLSRIQGCHYHLSKFHIYALVYCIGVFLSGLLHSV